MISVDVPGKLYIAGEYAVLEPGGAAVLVAVDRYLTVRLRPGTASTRTVTTARTGARPVEMIRRGTETVPAVDDPAIVAALRHVSTAVELIERYAIERGDDLLGFDLEIVSDLDHQSSGRKFGLGSSGAVTVGVIRTLAQAYRFPLDDDALLRLALLTAFAVDPRCSGGDVAASLLGGWISYRSPDRTAVAAMFAGTGVRITDLIEAPWPLLSAHRIPAPRAVCLEVGWSGRPAVSSGLVERLQRAVDDDSTGYSSTGYGHFVGASNACVATLVSALESGDDASAVAAVAAAGALLRAVSSLAGVVVETAELATLRRVAESLGAVAKSSGAGGGDCGIALIDAADAEQLQEEWRAVGIVPLELQVHQSEGLQVKGHSHDDRFAGLR
ncbi:phosphomevalonate kinase [Antrihabitans cavernicola]|uniref:phosphomevalonate kinase n=1 Tax=Antrihabitans cavernicola TaxID=2495913 RepID=A0A5A7S419_9NOCA|nr:phosphomevalonate kinase [Spelaeibacter cavernicola]KAA0020139.1 phosphomevalonate kinase [Spelaeibacter cavernicola]